MKGKTFGLRLNKVRSRAGMSVDDLAHRSGLNRATIYNLENGTQAMPGGQTVIQLCKVLNVSADYLLGLKPGEQQ